MGEGLLASDVVDEKGPNGASVIGPGDWPEILLTGSVTDKEFNAFVFDGDGFGPEFHADRDIVTSSGFAFNKLQNNARLADSRVSNHDRFE